METATTTLARSSDSRYNGTNVSRRVRHDYQRQRNMEGSLSIFKLI